MVMFFFLFFFFLGGAQGFEPTALHMHTLQLPPTTPQKSSLPPGLNHRTTTAVTCVWWRITNITLRTPAVPPPAQGGEKLFPALSLKLFFRERTLRDQSFGYSNHVLIQRRWYRTRVRQLTISPWLQWLHRLHRLHRLQC